MSGKPRSPLALALLFATKALAEEQSPVPTESFGLLLLRTMLVLGMVVVLIYLTLHFGLRKLVGGRALAFQGSLVTVLERIPLDQKRWLFVVKAGSEHLLIGGGDGSLSLIAKLDGAEVERALRERVPKAAMGPMLQKLFGRRGAPPP